jgi:SNF2 family DNA or RNA helicase
MGLLNSIRQRFPFPTPELFDLPEVEFSWPEIESEQVSIPTLDFPELSHDLIKLTSVVEDFSTIIDEPDTPNIDTELIKLEFEIIDVLDPFKHPAVNGAIYVKKEDESVRGGQVSVKTRVRPLKQRERIGLKEPKGFDIFELLLPVLMPPAKTEFAEELLFPGELYPFQRAGVKWLFENDTALLADDMGLGKTVQSITAFRALIRRSMALQALVICPKSVLTNWMRELERWAPELVAVRIYGDARNRRIHWHAFTGKCHVIVATYDTLRRDYETVQGRIFDLVIADEVQKVKNPNTATYRAIRNIPARKRWGLTGTPLENRLEEIVSVFGFIRPGLFKTSEASILTASGVRERIRPYILRRRKEEALPGLPDKVVDTKLLELTDAQRMTYDRCENDGVLRLKGMKDVTVQHVLALIQELKQICNFDPSTGESTKIEYLLEEFLEEACSDNQKAVIFSQYVKTLEQMADRVKSYNPLIYTGQLSTAQRDKTLGLFGTQDAYRILLLSLKAGGLGLNLTRANYVLHYDRWWNPAVERQAEDRTHRIGQLRTVFVTRLICDNTIEERIEKLLEQKKMLFQEVVDELADVRLERVLSEEELFGLFNLAPPVRSKEGKKEIIETRAPETEAVSSQRVMVVKPEEPYTNVLKLRQLLRQSEEYIHWIDLHFSARGLEELIASIDPALVRAVRILSGPANVDQRAKHDFTRFRIEFANKGIVAEWRILRDFSHDRFIISKDRRHNVPPINSLLRGQYSEISPTPNEPPFKQWWEKAVPIENWRT